MIFRPTPLDGAFEIDLTPANDDRGFFARSFCDEIFSRHGLPTDFPQCNISFNHREGTLRGLHGTTPAVKEGKLVRCTAGQVWDVMVDARPGSPAFGTWHAVVLSAANHCMVYIPPGCLHGFLTLTPSAELFYQMSAPYAPEASIGVLWNDPELAIRWPAPPRMMSSRDLALRSWREMAKVLRDQA